MTREEKIAKAKFAYAVISTFSSNVYPSDYPIEDIQKYIFTMRKRYDEASKLSFEVGRNTAVSEFLADYLMDGLTNG